MPGKDYHKGVKLQVYIPEDLNERINACIESINANYLQHMSKSDFVRIVLGKAADRYLNQVNTQK